MNKGFTLVELMVTVAVIAMLAAISFPMYQRQKCRGQFADAQSCLSEVSIRMENYRSNHGRYPDSASIWADLGLDAAPICGSYETGADTTDNQYLVWAKDTEDELPCTAGSGFDNDTWAVINNDPRVYHVFDVVKGLEDPLPADFPLTIP